MSKLSLIIVPAICILVIQTGVIVAYGHFFGATKNIDNYQIIFAPNPTTPIAGDNSTSLNFSVLENNANIYNIYTAMVVTEKQSWKLLTIRKFLVDRVFSLCGWLTYSPNKLLQAVVL